MFVLILGSISVAFSLKSNQHIPARMVRTINGRISSMTENGLHKFYRSFSAFLFELNANKFRDDNHFDNIQALNMQQFIPPLTYYLFNLLTGFITLMIEIIYNRLNAGRWNFQWNHQ